MNRLLTIALLMGALILSACAGGKEIVTGSTEQVGITAQIVGTAVVPIIGYNYGDYVNVPVLSSDNASIGAADQCNNRDALSVYGSITGNATVATAGSPSAGLNVGRGMATGPAATGLTTAAILAATGGDSHGDAPAIIAALRSCQPNLAAAAAATTTAKAPATSQ